MFIFLFSWTFLDFVDVFCYLYKYRLTIESKEIPRADGGYIDEAVLVSNLNLVDLAGSESVKHTGATGQRAKEGKY